MRTDVTLLFFRAWITLAFVMPTALTAQDALSDAAIQAILIERLAATPTMGLVVGVVGASGARRYVTHGASGTNRPLDEHSVFEIGSITKVFTTSVLALMAATGDVSLDDPVTKFLPSTVTFPESGRAIRRG